MYYLHRISHEWPVSKCLLDEGYLSIGWSRLKASGIETMSWEQFVVAFDEQYPDARSRNGLWRFLHAVPGDTVVVPLYDKQFAIATVADKAASADIISAALKEKTGIRTDTDIGFCIPVKDTVILPRSYAPARLQQRMKIRQTNAEISDLRDEIEAARAADSPLNLQAVIRENVTKPMLDCIRKLTPDNLENLVRWYMLKLGANRAEVLPKYSKAKIEWEDADVIAYFDVLGVTFLIQVKQHVGETSAHAVEQISKYMDLRIDSDDDITYVPWVISTADSFSYEAENMAGEKGVRLINGPAFVQMLLDAGIDTINSGIRL